MQKPSRKLLILYALFCGIFCSLIFYLIEKKISTSWLYSLTPFFGFFEIKRDTATIQYWFISCITFYYLIFPLVFKFLDVYAVLCLISIILLLSVVVIYLDVSMYTSMYHSSIFRFPEFLLGIAIARVKWLERFFFSKSVHSLAIGFLFFILGYLFLFINVLYSFGLFFLSSGAYLILSQIWCRVKSFSASVGKLFEIMSRGTFSLYLLHMVTIYYFYNFLNNLLDKSGLQIFLVFFLRLFIIISLSVSLLLIGGVFEKKFSKFVSKICY